MLEVMTFDNIDGNRRLWAVKYDEDAVNVLGLLFRYWSDIDWLADFFSSNKADLERNFQIRSVDKAIYDTLMDVEELECMILDLAEDSDLDKMFRPLNNMRTSELLLGKEKAKGKRGAHSSWLRLYALRLEKGVYLITGGAIKLTYTMQERSHTLKELERMEMVRNHLIENGVTDLGGFVDFVKHN
jgi:hypothetical protein